MTRHRCLPHRYEQLEHRTMLTTLNPSAESFYRWTTPARPPADDIRIEGTSASLTRHHDQIDISFETRSLVPGNVYTGWWAVFNYPDACPDSECGPPNLRDPAVQALVYYGGEVVVQANGTDGFASFRGSLGRDQVCKDTEAMVCEPIFEEPWHDLPAADIGLVDPFAAAIHFVIRDHGPALPHPALLQLQKTTFDGGCLLSEFETFEDELPPALSPNQCRNVQFTAHDPIDIDFNDNGTVAGNDIDMMFFALGSNDKDFDLDDDDDVTQSDLDILLRDILLSEYGDTNLDHVVDFADFLALTQNFGRTDVGWAEGDFNGDRQADFDDFQILSSNFGTDRKAG